MPLEAADYGVRFGPAAPGPVPETSAVPMLPSTEMSSIPIDPERDTFWALVELLYGLQRDARRRWRRIRSRRWWKVLRWLMGTIATAVLGTAADHRFHLVAQLLQHLD